MNGSSGCRAERKVPLVLGFCESLRSGGLKLLMEDLLLSGFLKTTVHGAGKGQMATTCTRHLLEFTPETSIAACSRSRLSLTPSETLVSSLQDGCDGRAALMFFPSQR